VSTDLSSNSCTHSDFRLSSVTPAVVSACTWLLSHFALQSLMATPYDQRVLHSFDHDLFECSTHILSLLLVTPRSLYASVCLLFLLWMPLV
jgi:hypothetical protein